MEKQQVLVVYQDGSFQFVSGISLGEALKTLDLVREKLLGIRLNAPAASIEAENGQNG
jgi:hypothetical protein